MAAKKVEKIVLQFTEDGIEAFENYLQEKRDNPNKSVPDLKDSGNVEQYIPTGSVLKIEIPQTDLWHHELADHIIGFFDTNKIAIKSTFGNRGLWTYLSYLFLDKHLSRKGHKPKKIGKVHRSRRNLELLQTCLNCHVLDSNFAHKEQWSRVDAHRRHSGLR